MSHLRTYPSRHPQARPKPLPTSPQPSFQKCYEVLTRLANRHNNLDPDTWGFKVPRYIDIDNDCRISRLAQFTLGNGKLLYILAENCEIITSECIRQIAQD